MGLPSALSYSAVDLRAFGVPVLDLLDETVGTLALPVAAVLIAVVFSRLQPAEAFRTQVPNAAIRWLVRGVIPAVLVAVTLLRVLTGRNLGAWGVAAGRRVVGWRPAGAFAAGALALLLIGDWLLDRTARG